MLHVDAHVISA